MSSAAKAPSRWAILFAFAAVYFVWGSTYLAMRVGVRTIPPFLLGAARFFLAGALLWGFAAAQGLTRHAQGHWRRSAIAGALLLVGGNGGVVWSVQYIPSGLAALVVGAVPLWIVAIEWAQGARKPTLRVSLGLVAGLAGMAVLLLPDVLASLRHRGDEQHHALGIIVVLLASLSWSFGSLYTRKIRIPEAPSLAPAMQTLVGGFLLLVLSGVTGEWQGFSFARVGTSGVLSVAYLVVFGSLLAYSAYIWLLQVVAPARVSTYAFVNPVVAVLLGCLILNEPLNPRMLVSAAIVIAGVALITIAPRPAQA